MLVSEFLKRVYIAQYELYISIRDTTDTAILFINTTNIGTI